MAYLTSRSHQAPHSVEQVTEAGREVTTLDLPPSAARLLIDMLKEMGAGRAMPIRRADGRTSADVVLHVGRTTGWTSRKIRRGELHRLEHGLPAIAFEQAPHQGRGQLRNDVLRNQLNEVWLDLFAGEPLAKNRDASCACELPIGDFLQLWF